jgi:hypothetical protein
MAGRLARAGVDLAVWNRTPTHSAAATRGPAPVKPSPARQAESRVPRGGDSCFAAGALGSWLTQRRERAQGPGVDNEHDDGRWVDWRSTIAITGINHSAELSAVLQLDLDPADAALLGHVGLG